VKRYGPTCRNALELRRLRPAGSTREEDPCVVLAGFREVRPLPEALPYVPRARTWWGGLPVCCDLTERLIGGSVLSGGTIGSDTAGAVTFGSTEPLEEALASAVPELSSTSTASPVLTAGRNDSKAWKTVLRT
jgi:hypothetical protein